MADKPLPSWYTPEKTQQAAPAGTPLPGWYSPEPTTSPVSTPADYGAAENFLTGLLKVPGAIIGTPAMLEHTKNWLGAKIGNAVTGGNMTGADIDKTDPLYQDLPKSDKVDQAVFDTLHIKPYQPTSPLGQAGQVATTAGATAFLDPAADLAAVKQAPTLLKAVLEYAKAAAPQVGKNAAAGAVAQGSQQLFPDTPGLAATAALLTHSGLGAGAAAAGKGYKAFLQPVISPKAAGKGLAGDAADGLDNTQPGLAVPTRTDLASAADATKQATDSIGTGLDDYETGGLIRTDLQLRKDTLEAKRGAAAADAYGAFRGEQPLEGAKLAPFVSRPGFQAAVKAASKDVLDEGGKPLTEFWDFNEAGDPILKPNAAVPPDVLDRIKGKLDDAVSAAAPGSRGQRSATMLRNQFVQFLDNHFPDTYPKTRADFAAASRPLDPLETGPVGKVLDSTKRYGSTVYTVPQDKVASAFLKPNTSALRSDFDNLVAAYGGDKAAAASHLEQNLAAKVQGAVNGDGTLSVDAFNKAVKPYTRALQMWFPDLSKKFATAVDAQKTLDTLRTQKVLSDDITSGALRDDSGIVTRKSAQKWLAANEDALEKSQPPGALVRLKQFAASLPDAPIRGPEATAEAAPMVLGATAAGLTGGATAALEGGVLGGITHNIPGFFTSPRLATLRDEYSSQIERMFKEPAYAESLAREAAKRRVPMKTVVLEQAQKAVRATPVVTNAASPR